MSSLWELRKGNGLTGDESPCLNQLPHWSGPAHDGCSDLVQGHCMPREQTPSHKRWEPGRKQVEALWGDWHRPATSPPHLLLSLQESKWLCSVTSTAVISSHHSAGVFLRINEQVFCPEVSFFYRAFCSCRSAYSQPIYTRIRPVREPTKSSRGNSYFLAELNAEKAAGCNHLIRLH